jgi:uncharacterized SAM-binding protein YcdF (DUF218 family)
MFFVLSKTLDALLSPLTWTLLFGLLALLLIRRKRRLALSFGILAIVILAVASHEFTASALTGVLEDGVQSTMKDGVEYDAVIVLSGMLDGSATERHKQPSYNDNIERLLVAFQLLRDGRAKFVLLSGGASRIDGNGPVEASVLAEQLKKWGIDPARIIEEKNSRNTRENAAESAKIIAQQNWKKLLLVTSAFHVPRALGCFKQVGLQPDLLPVDYRYGGGGGSWVPRAGALGITTGAIRELAGRAVYRVIGYAR